MPSKRLLLHPLFSLLALGAASPSVYWRTSPVASNSTVLFAGAAFGSAPLAFACLDGPACQAPRLPLALAAASWESSLFFTYPPICALAQPACAFALCSAED